MADGVTQTNSNIAGDDSTVINIPKNSVPDVMRNAPHPSQNTLHTLKRGDEEVQVTTDQLVKMAQKGWNADVETQKARETQKEHAADLRLAEDVKAVILEGDEDAFRRMALTAGIRGQELEELVAQTFGDDEDDDEEETPQRTPAGNGRIDLGQLPNDVQRLLLGAERQRIKGIVDEALDKNEKVRYNMEQYDPKGRAAIRSLIDEKIKARLADTNGDFGDGRFILPDVLREVEGMLEALNSPTRKVAPLGVGPAPGGDGFDSYPKKLPDHVPSTSGSFDQHILETLAFHQANAERSR